MHARYFRQARPTKEVKSMSIRIRQLHRWLGLLFTATVIANFIAMIFGPPPPWITFAPLGPLFLLMFSGLYMFFRPYVAGRPA
jgi:hypothetical protein